MNLTEWGKSLKVAPNEVKFASTWIWSSFSNLWRAYKIIVEIHTQQNSPHGFTVIVHRTVLKMSMELSQTLTWPYFSSAFSSCLSNLTWPKFQEISKPEKVATISGVATFSFPRKKFNSVTKPLGKFLMRNDSFLSLPSNGTPLCGQCNLLPAIPSSIIGAFILVT